jgi:heme-degrading monooxygenase HmoA
MFAPHTHDVPRFAPPSGIAHTAHHLRNLMSQARPSQRFAAVTSLAAVSGLCIGLAMPRGPVTSAEALVLLIVGVVVGFASGLILRSRWAMLLAPAAQIVAFELGRLRASGPTVDGISVDGMFGPLAFIVCRGFFGLVGVLPMIVAAAYGAAVPRRSEPQRQRRLRSRIGLYLRRGVTALAALAVLGLVYLLACRRACRRSATQTATSFPAASPRWRRYESTAPTNGSRSAPGVESGHQHALRHEPRHPCPIIAAPRSLRVQWSSLVVPVRHWRPRAIQPDVHRLPLGHSRNRRGARNVSSPVFRTRSEGGDAVAAPYTHTSWDVKRGREQEFVERWSEWADWSRREGLAARAMLLRDVDSRERFVSFGPWESVQAVRSWRALPGYQERVARLREVVDHFEPRTLEVVIER